MLTIGIEIDLVDLLGAMTTGEVEVSKIGDGKLLELLKKLLPLLLPLLGLLGGEKAGDVSPTP